MYIREGSQDININTTQSWTPAVLFVGGEFSGSIGTAAAPLTLGNMTTVIIAARKMKSMYLSSSGTITDLIVYDTRGGEAYGFYLSGGTTTTFRCLRGSPRIGQSATVTTGICHHAGAPNDARPFIEAGATITTWTQSAGYTTNESDITTVNLYGGTFESLGDTEGTHTTVTQTGGLFLFSCNGETITTLNLYDGTFDCRQDARPKTVATSNIYGGDAFLHNESGQVTATTRNGYGGRCSIGFTNLKVNPPGAGG